MTELVSIKNMPIKQKIQLVKKLGYSSDGEFVLQKSGEQYLDKYIGKPVRLDNMVILPGSTLILDDNQLSISSYLEEYGDVLEGK